ncbi:prothoracicostatic peptides-like isoform X1 [Daphnia pulicaria]|uniref:prothoracicostatic peptides-like isoform X1 n=1 Tax=Daphnia pulicaria TaxID=35523 RepID=UPI001EEC1667|nr:prothoracicostatic peptides-like isoform X1 [Daphnia pulicaria]XP_046642794.1 prothoracicostatic peptides-like isoform X1 [Daphnia pulicaria]
MQFWQCPLLLMVSLIAAINTQQTPSQRFEPNQVAGLVELHQQLEQPREHQEQHHQQQQPEQPAQADNKDYAPSPAVLLQLTPSDWKNTQDKRNNWNRMQGMWGKRSQQQSDGSALSEMTPPRQMVKRAWSDLSQQGWGKRSWTQLHGVWGKRRWDQLHGAWGKRTPDQLEDDSKAEQSENSQEDEDQQQSSSEVEREEANDSDDTVENSKRSGWNKMQGVWGKRSSSSSVNSGPAIEGMGNNDLLLLISGTGDQLYQQREDDQAKVNVEDAGNEDKRGWNQLQGVWGKRALSAMAAGYKRNWNNLRGAWGKREIPAAIAKGMEWSRKRESGWNNLKGLWG